MKWIIQMFKKIRAEIAYRKRLKKLRKQDPFIY